MKYFTSDLHLNSTTINVYAKRPWKTAEEAGESIIAAITRKCKPQDSLIHVGDFMLTSADRHGVIEDIPLKIKSDEWIARIPPRLFLLKGNHDNGHGVVADANCLIVDLGKYKEITVGHYPSFDFYKAKREKKVIWNYEGLYGDDNYIHLHLCGHVHNAWLLLYDAVHNVLNVNVGLDVWNYAPVSEVQLIQLLDFVQLYLSDKLKSKQSWTMTRAEFNLACAQTQSKLKQEAKLRREEKKRKKGLTPEECERRKQAAIAAKKQTK